MFLGHWWTFLHKVESVHGTRAASVLVRQGHVAIYPDHGFEGQPIVLEMGKVFNVRDASWLDKTVRSWFASASAFDPAIPRTVS